MVLTVAYWRGKWDRAKSDLPEENAVTAGKVLSLLANYAAYSKTLMTFGWHKERVGSTLHFFSKRWADQYVIQVGNAIHNFYHVAGEERIEERFHNVEFILARVKQEMGNTPLDPNDNLAKILEVIHEKTTVDYASLDADMIISDCENRQSRPRRNADVINPIPRLIATVETFPLVEVSAVREDMIDPDVSLVIATPV